MDVQNDGSCHRQPAYWSWGLAAAVALGLAGCGSNSDVAPASAAKASASGGVYIVQDGKLGRLDEARDKVVQTWKLRTNLSERVQFLVIDDSVAAGPVDADKVSLQKVARVRDNIERNGKATKAAKAEWVVANIPSMKIPVTVTRESDNPRQLRVVANQPLTAGLYSLTYRTGKKRIGGRFGIGWDSADKEQYAQQVCVDRYKSEPAFFRPCAERDSHQNAALNVHDLKVRKEVIGGKPTLVLEGKVTNASATRQNVPLLLAVINDKKGLELTRWTFQPQARQLSPGATVTFRTANSEPPKGTSGVAVLIADSVMPRQDAESSTSQSFLSDGQLPPQ
jgi:hypothetical protein